MLSLTRPSDARIRRFLARQRGLPYSYPDAGASLGEPPAGYVLDHHRVRLGEGPQAFDLARAALRGWAMFRVGWVEALPASGAHRGGGDRRPPRPRVRPLGPVRLPDRPGDRGARAGRVVRVRLRHPAGACAQRRGAVHGRVGPRGGLRLVRPARDLPAVAPRVAARLSPGPPDPAAVRPGIPAGHGPGPRGRRAMSGRSFVMPGPDRTGRPAPHRAGRGPGLGRRRADAAARMGGGDAAAGELRGRPARPGAGRVRRPPEPLPALADGRPAPVARRPWPSSASFAVPAGGAAALLALPVAGDHRARRPPWPLETVAGPARDAGGLPGRGARLPRGGRGLDGDRAGRAAARWGSRTSSSC